MKCPKCGNEVGNEKFCPECGTALNGPTEVQHEEAYKGGKPKKKKGCGCLIAILVLVALGLMVSFSQAVQLNSVEQPAFDALKYVHEDGSGLTEDELVALIGEPDKTEDWTYNNEQPIHTLYYGNDTYDFVFERLHRITRYEPVHYESKGQFLALFGLKKTDKTTVKDTGVWYRAYNCGINDLWLEYGDEKITTTIITYSTFFN